MCEVLGIFLVHVGEVSHIRQEDGDLDNFRNIRSRCAENCAYVFDTQSGLFLKGSGLEDLAGRVAGNAARGEDEALSFDSVRLLHVDLRLVYLVPQLRIDVDTGRELETNVRTGSYMNIDMSVTNTQLETKNKGKDTHEERHPWRKLESFERPWCYCD